MTIRHLIRKAKLQIIQKQYDHLFVFHCSGLTNSQWRQFKHVLYLSQANTLFGGPRFTLLPCTSIDNTHTISKLHSTVDWVSFNKNKPGNPCQSNDTQHRALNCTQEPSTKKNNPWVPDTNSTGCFTSSGFPNLLGNSTTLAGPTCLLYVTQPFTLSNSNEIDVSARHNKLATARLNRDFASKSNRNKHKYSLLDISQDIHKKVTWPDLLTQIRVSSYNTSLVLLYGQIQFIGMNHMDIQHATHVQNVSVLHSLIPSINDPVQELCVCLSQPFLEFLWHNSVHPTPNAHHNSTD